jgi:hypothetical protein
MDIRIAVAATILIITVIEGTMWMQRQHLRTMAEAGLRAEIRDNNEGCRDCETQFRQR